MSISKEAKKLLDEIIEHRYENGQCDLGYWKRRFEELSAASSSTFFLRSLFNELSQAGLIKLNWASDGIYIMNVLPKGLEYFNDIPEEVVANVVYNNNIYGDVKDTQIIQGYNNSAQKNREEIPDIEKITELIAALKKYDGLFEEEFGKENARIIREETENLSSDSSSIKSKALEILKEIFINDSGSVLASGFISLITSIIGTV
jgi:hypothetical protein